MSASHPTVTMWPLLSRLLELPAREQVYLQTDRPMRPGTQFSVRLRLNCFMMMMIMIMTIMMMTMIMMIRFEYQLSHSLEGFYLSTYTDQAGKER